MKERVIDAKKSSITPLFVGREACTPGHSFGPYIRDCYLVHFCLGGRGVLKNKHGTHNVSEGQLFVIRPGEITTYTADMKEPWEYIWVAFRSDEIFFKDECSVFDTPKELDDKLITILDEEILPYEGCLAIIYSLIYQITRKVEADGGDDRVRRIKRYIKYNYMLPITVSSIAERFGFNRTYLYSTFKAKYGIGIKEYITSVRMEKASEFLKSGYTVKQSAHMVGYDDEFNFSKAFKARYGVSPSKIRA